MKGIDRRPSPATAISVVALLVALGGTSYAAVSVSSSDIRDNTIRSKDLRDRGVKTRDLGKDAVRSLQVGDDALSGDDIAESTLGVVPSATAATTAQTAQTAANADSAKTATSAQTAARANSAYSTSRAADLLLGPGGAQQQVLTLNVPKPGNYVILGQATLNNNAAVPVSIECRLTAGADTTSQSEGLTAQAAGTSDFGSIFVSTMHEFGAAGNAILTCNNPTGVANDTSVSHRRVTAIEIESLTDTPASGP